MAEQPTAGNGQKKKKAFMIVGAVVILGLIAGYFVSAYNKTHISTDDAFIDGDIYTIAARINGTIKSVYVDSNQRVIKGELLVELDPLDYQSRKEAANANRELQRANLRQAERELKRARTLFESETSSADRYDKAVSTQEIAAAQVKLAEEQLRQAELNLGYTVIKAPADGYVTKKNVMPGNQIQAGQPLMAVVNLDELKVIANYKETELARIRPGQKVRIKVDSYPGRSFNGTVDSIMAGTGVTFSLFPAENATGNYVKVVQRIPVRIVLEPGADKEHLLKVGMSVVPTVIAK
jgi:membrane fusion protein (multidrug efflux system)